MPNYRPTNSGLQTKGALWAGFDPTTTSILAGVFMASVMVTFASVSKGRIHWAFATFVFFALPNAVTISTILFLVIGKPPRYLRDWIESKILGRSYVRLDQIPEPPPEPIQE